MQNFDFTTQFDDIAHLLPESFVALMTVAGAEAAFTLLHHYAGTHIPIGKNQTKAGKALHAILAEVLEESVVDKIEAAYANQRKLWIPKCDDALRELRNRYIRQQFDEMTQTMTATLAVSNLVYQHKMTDRHIWRILKEPDRLPANSHAQMALF